MKKLILFAQPRKMIDMKKHVTAPPGWRTPPETRTDLNFVISDLQRTFLRLADFLVVTDYTSMKINNFPDSVLRK